MKLFCSGVGERFPGYRRNASRRMKAWKPSSMPAQRRDQDYRDPGRHRRCRIRDVEADAARERGTIRDLLYGACQDAVQQAQQGQDVEGRTRKLPALPIRVYGPPPTSGTRDAPTKLIMTAGCDNEPGHGQGAQEGERRPSTRPSAPRCARTAPSSRRARTTI